MIRINMRSASGWVKGQGVGSCYDEQVGLLKDRLHDKFQVTENANGKFDIIHYHTVNLSYYINRLMTKNKSIGVGYVHFIPDTLEGSLALPWLFKKVFYRYMLKFYNSMDYLVAVNPEIIPRLTGKYGVDKPKVCYIPNYVSEKRFFPLSREEKMNIRNRYGIKKDAFVVLGAGQFQTRKGIFDFIETAQKTPEATFLWAGGFSFGRLSDGYGRIKKIVENPPANVVFLGICERSEMINIYNMSDILFLPSFDELFPMAILEALCCRLPILLRDITVYKPVFTDCYLKGNTPDDFANHIKLLSNNNDDWRYWSDKAWECHCRYTEDILCEIWERFYSDISDV